ncbi:sialate O-acetylesterase [Sphingobacterium chuzhouense]|uniref:Sialate O-acetylesterase n=1 Tax=Sphingobacterium chuzhouense TaxID=1742264 RepID=A0ABR7XMW3_9SPHI|nr:sialate O-acetylesterase [Sphingobacterium chuzhouense]MBD1420507.1 sialate O-acetylesterase [Sphingobacterium chuzhouense]
MRVLIILFLLSVSLGLHAEVRLSAIFTDGMVLQQQKSVPIWGWAGKGATVSVRTSWNQKAYKTKANENGIWRVFIQTPEAGGPYNMQVSEGNTITLQDIFIGEVWLCSGQSNMEMPLKGYPAQPILGSTEAILKSQDEQLRLYTVPRNPLLKPADDSKPSQWKKAGPENVANFSATAYFFGQRLRKILKVPVGLIHSSYGGSNIEAWMDAAWLKDIEGVNIPQQEEELKDKNRQPTMLYNGMINPIAGYGIKGIIWYQGESNYESPDQYEVLFPRMVAKYRELWEDDTLPFYYTQIAPFDYASLPPYYVGGKYNSAFIRDAQRKSLANIQHSGMAVTMDLGELNCIHPAKKKEGADRLALLALGDTYGINGLNHRSPAYERIEIQGSTVVVQFNDAPLGLTSFGKEIKTFEIAGEDKVFRPANAIVKGKTVVVSSPHVAKPVAVRYAFKDFVMGDLFGVNGLPVSSFRTDDW